MSDMHMDTPPEEDYSKREKYVPQEQGKCCEKCVNGGAIGVPLAGCCNGCPCHTQQDAPKDKVINFPTSVSDFAGRWNAKTPTKEVSASKTGTPLDGSTSQDATGWEKEYEEFVEDHHVSTKVDPRLLNETDVKVFLREALTAQKTRLVAQIEGMLRPFMKPVASVDQIAWEHNARNNALHRVLALINETKP